MLYTNGMEKREKTPRVLPTGIGRTTRSWSFINPKSIEEVRGEDVEEEIQKLKENVWGLAQWNPADLKLPSKEACSRLAVSFNLIEKGAAWPMQLMITRAAFLAKGEDSDMGPLAYRVQLMLASVYRLLGKIRLLHLQP